MIIILNMFYYGGNYDIICLKIMFFLRCLEYMLVINYVIFYYFYVDIIVLFYRGGILLLDDFFKNYQNIVKRFLCF